jgi:hypothetical protein
VDDRLFAAQEEALGLLRRTAGLVFVSLPLDLLPCGGPGGMDLADQEARRRGTAQIDQAEFHEFVVLDGEMGRIRLPENLNHASIMVEAGSSVCEAAHRMWRPGCIDICPELEAVSGARTKTQPQILRLRLAQKRPNSAQDDSGNYAGHFRDRTLVTRELPGVRRLHDPQQRFSAHVFEGEVDQVRAGVYRDRMRVRHVELRQLLQFGSVQLEHGHCAGFG